jgi:hypothetical protein
LLLAAIGGGFYGWRRQFDPSKPKPPAHPTVHAVLRRGDSHLTASGSSPPRINLICVLAPADDPKFNPIGNWNKR